MTEEDVDKKERRLVTLILLTMILAPLVVLLGVSVLLYCMFR